MDFDQTPMKSLFDVLDNVCYYWDPAQHKLLRFDLLVQDFPAKTKFNLKQLKYQEKFNLVPHPTFDVTHLSIRISAEIRALIWGPYGLALVRLPSAAPNANGPEIAAKCWLIDEKTFADHPNLLVLQAKWLRSSRNVLVVLNNDGWIRLYENGTGVGSVRVFREPLVPPRDFLAQREENWGGSLAPVDFDFGPTIGKRVSVFLVGETGTISYVLIKGPEKSKSTQYSLQEGPFLLNGESNSRAGSILASNQIPTRLVVGDKQGIVTHYFLFPSTRQTEAYDMESCFTRGDLTLQLIERIKFTSNGKLTRGTKTLLAWEPESDTRYTFVHERGVHIVSMRSTRTFAIPQKGPSRVLDSSAKNIVAWKLDEEVKEANSVLGFAFTSPISNRFIFLFGNLDSLSLDLPLIFAQDFFWEPPLLSLERNYEDNEVQNHVADILKNKTNIPFLSTCGELKGFELTSYGISAINKLMIEYLSPLRILVKFLCERIEKMKAVSRDFQLQLGTHSENVQYFKSMLQILAELYEELVEDEERFGKRCAGVDKRIWESNPCITDEEKEWRKKLEVMKAESRKLNAQVANLKGVLALRTMNGESERGLGSSTMEQPFYGEIDLAEAKEKIFKHQEQISQLTTALKQLM